MQQGRWVSYIFKYRDNARCDNAGFIKVQRIASKYRVVSVGQKAIEKKSDIARIQIGIRMYKKQPCRCLIYLMYRQEGAATPRISFLEEMNFKQEERDTIAKRFELNWDNPLGDGRPFDSYDGLFFVCDDGDIFAGMWDEYAFNPSDVRSFAKEQKKEETIREKNTKENEAKAVEGVKERNGTDEQTTSSIEPEKQTSEEPPAEKTYQGVCQEMLDTFPKLPTFSDSQFLECVKIVPHDIGRLAMANWKLGINSFLSHGYYHYKYIMMGKIKFERKEAFVIGVPGVYTNKEKYLANMFGFSVFIPVKKTKFLSGNFGYWISEIVTE